MTNRLAGLFGITGTAIFWISLLVFGTLRAGYSQLDFPISFLGVVGSPNAIAWNLIGFILPGACLAIAGATLALSIDGKKSIFWWLLVMSGLSFSGTGVIPAETDGGRVIFDSLYTQGHILFSSLSALFWWVAAWLAPLRARRTPGWRRTMGTWTILAAIATLGLAVSGFSDYLPWLSDHGGAAQRIAFGAYFLWFVVASRFLLHASRTGPSDERQ